MPANRTGKVPVVLWAHSYRARPAAVRERGDAARGARDRLGPVGLEPGRRVRPQRCRPPGSASCRRDVREYRAQRRGRGPHAPRRRGEAAGVRHRRESVSSASTTAPCSAGSWAWPTTGSMRWSDDVVRGADASSSSTRVRPSGERRRLRERISPFDPVHLLGKIDKPILLQNARRRLPDPSEEYDRLDDAADGAEVKLVRRRTDSLIVEARGRPRRLAGRQARGSLRLVKIGVLAVQGNFREHAAMLRRLGAEPVEVRKPEQLDGLDGLVIPGGESTAIMRLVRLYGLEEASAPFARPVFGTCAGMILLDRDHLGLIDLGSPERLRPPGRELRGRPRARGRRRAAPRRLHPRAAGRGGRPGGRGARRARRRARARASRVGSSWPRSTRS